MEQPSTCQCPNTRGLRILKASTPICTKCNKKFHPLGYLILLTPEISEDSLSDSGDSFTSTSEDIPLSEVQRNPGLHLGRVERILVL